MCNISKLLAVFVVSSILASNAFAAELISSVVQVVDAENAAQPALILLSADGRVLHVASNQTEALAQFKLAALTGSALEITFDDLGKTDLVSSVRVLAEDSAQTAHGNVSTLSSVAALLRARSLQDFAGSADSATPDAPGYTPTVLPSYDYAVSVFNSLNTRMKKKSECFMRAHLWAYDMSTRLGIKSEKTFLFFTSKYIREYSYKWWFHVAPMVYVPEGQLMMDPEFADMPLTLKNWTDSFMENKVDCPVAPTYGAYRTNQEASDCYVRQVPMYYYQPSSVEQADAKGETLLNWVEWDLKNMKKGDK